MHHLSHTFATRWAELHAALALPLITSVDANYKALINQSERYRQGKLICSSKLSRIRLAISTNNSVDRKILPNHTQKPFEQRINIPVRVRQRWLANVGTCFFYRIRTACIAVYINPEDLKEYWRLVEPSIPDEELFSLLEKAFGTHRCLASKVGFVKEVVRRYKAMGAPVRLFGVPIFCLSVCLLCESCCYVEVMYVTHSCIIYRINSLHDKWNGMSHLYSHWLLMSQIKKRWLSDLNMS